MRVADFLPACGEWRLVPVLAVEIYSYTKTGDLNKKENNLESDAAKVIAILCHLGFIEEISRMKDHKDFTGFVVILMM